MEETNAVSPEVVGGEVGRLNFSAALVEGPCSVGDCGQEPGFGGPMTPFDIVKVDEVAWVEVSDRFEDFASGGEGTGWHVVDEFEFGELAIG